MFTLSVAINCSITIFFAFYCISAEGWKLLYVIGLIEALIFCGLGWLLSGFTVVLVSLIKISFSSSRLLATAGTNWVTAWRNIELQWQIIMGGGDTIVLHNLNKQKLRASKMLEYMSILKQTVGSSKKIELLQALSKLRT